MAVTAKSRLEILQVYKLLQSVRQEDIMQISKLCTQGIPMLINYQEPQDGECALHLAAKSNNANMAKYLLSLGALTDVQDFKGRTPIMKAAEYGHDKTVELLANCGANMKMRDLEGKDVMFYCICATKRHKKCLDIVLTHSADLNNVTETGDSALSIACLNAEENEDLCLMLLEKGANPNAVNKVTGRSTLSIACGTGCVQVIQALLSRGADPNIIDKKRRSPLHFAALKGSFQAVKSLMSYGADCNVLDVDGNNGLHNAAEGGYGTICKYLAQRGCNPKLKNTDGFIPRLLAKEKSHKDAGKELRKAEKAFVKFSKPGMKNPNDPELVMFYDWVYERQEFIRAELKQEVMPPSGDNNASSKENFISRENFEKVMVKLKAPMLEAEAKNRLLEVHDRDRRGVLEIEDFLSGKKYISKTYLMSAFEAKKKKGKKGKGKKGKGKKGKKAKIPMPICVAKEGPRRPDGGPPLAYVEKQVQWTDVTRFSRDRPPRHPLEDDSAWYVHAPEKVFMNITDAAKMGDIDTLKAAFKSGTPVDTRDKYFKTPLMVAAVEGDLELTKYLLRIGASVDARDNFKWTPLHHACHSGQLDIVKELALAGSDLNAITWNGATTLMRAIEGGKAKVVRFLLDCGVNILHENKKEKSALDVARDWADNEIYFMIKDAYDAVPKPKKDAKGGKGKGKGKSKPPSAPKPLTMPPIPQGHMTAPATPGGTSEGQKPDEENKENAIPSIENTSPSIIRIEISEPALPDPFNTVQKKGTILDLASELAAGKVGKKEDVTFSPRKVWNEQPTTNELVVAREEKRARFGFEVDFEDYEKPLGQTITRVTKAVREQKAK